MCYNESRRRNDGALCTELFLTVAREENISAAARVLHLAQPALSRQLRNLEEELGKALFTRGARRITLTKEGRILKCRAEHMLSLAEKTKAEIMSHAETLEGDLYIGAGETMGVHYLTHVVSNLHKCFPGIRLRMRSGDSLDLANQLDSELLDFALLFSPIDPLKYNMLPIPYENTWGLLMRQDDPLAGKERLVLADLNDLPLIVSRQYGLRQLLENHPAENTPRLNVVGSYSLLYNGSLMAEDGLGYVLGIDGIINVTGNSPLCFRPIDGLPKANMFLV